MQDSVLGALERADLELRADVWVGVELWRVSDDTPQVQIERSVTFSSISFWILDV